MAVTNNQVLRMVFANQAGGNVTINLDNPLENLAAAEITAVMDTIITKNIFTSTGGDLVSKKDAKIIDTASNDLYEPVA